MVVMQEIRRRLRHIVGPFLGLSALVYFGYHTVHGDRGLLAWWHLRHDIRQAEENLAQVAETRRGMERRAQLLRTDNLDPDMLEERARVMLNMARPDEIVVFDR